MSDEELRERIELDWLWLTHTCSTAEQKSVDRTLDKMVQLITADRKRVALEARLNEVQNAYEYWINGRKFISSYFRDRIALLSNTKESK